jgi:hypothetical protein
MSKPLSLFFFLLSSCILKEETPDNFIYDTINPDCAYGNYGEIDSLLPVHNAVISYVEEHKNNDYTILALTNAPGSVGYLELILKNRRPKKSGIIVFESGYSTSDILIWTWKIQADTYEAYNGKLYVQVFANMKVKFTWCDFEFRNKKTGSIHKSRGSFLLN